MQELLSNSEIALTSQKFLSVWSDFGHSKIDHTELVSFLKDFRKLKEVSIDISSECNFSCAYCIYSSIQLHREILTIEQWKRVIDEALSLGASLFALAAREPLYNSRYRDILLYLKKKKEILGEDLFYGLVTNGWFLKDSISDLKKCGLNYLDVSIDGPKLIHDTYRKSGSFDRAIEGLMLAQKEMVADKLFVSTVLHAKNYRDIPLFIKKLYKMGIKHFSLGLLYPTIDIPKELLFCNNEIELFLTDLLPTCISELNDACDLEIIINFNVITSCLPQLRDMVFKKIIDIGDICMDDNGNLFSHKALHNGCNIFMIYSAEHIEFGKILKITADGYVNYHCEEITGLSYLEKSLGNVADISLKEIYESLFYRDSYLYNFINSIDKTVCINEPCYPLCLGMNKYCTYKNPV